MSQIIVYPRHFTSRSPVGNGVVVSRGDETLETLYQFFMDPNVNSTSWTYRKRVLDTALRLFGDFGEWLNDQRSNPRISGYNLEFLKDTLNFIRTGRRVLSIQTAIELVSENIPHGITAAANQSTPSELILGRETSTISIIQAWCGQPALFEDRARGFEDLLLSMYVFFGASRDHHVM